MTLELKLNDALDCIGDFTYNFFWQHKGTKLKPSDRIPGTDHTYEDVVEALRHGEDVYISGNVGKRLGTSMGVDLRYFGGDGGAISNTGSIIVDGDAGSYLGMSMIAGAIYVRGGVKEPLGNVVEVKSDLKGYKKFRSITWLLHHPEELLPPNEYGKDELILEDGILRSTVAARNSIDAKIRVRGDTGISAGILMRKGMLIIEGNAGMNTAALLNGGSVVVLGDAAEFTGVEMRDGVVFVKGECKGYVGARMTGGRIICKMTKPVPPVREEALSSADMKLLTNFGITGVLALNYRRYVHP